MNGGEEKKGGSSKANEDLKKKVGKSAEVHPELLGKIAAKPHTKLGTGGGQSGRESHEARDSMVINKAKREVIKEKGLSSSAFQSSQLRSASTSKVKVEKAQDARLEKKAKNKDKYDETVRKALGFEPEEWSEFTAKEKREHYDMYEQIQQQLE